MTKIKCPNCQEPLMRMSQYEYCCINCHTFWKKDDEKTLKSFIIKDSAIVRDYMGRRMRMVDNKRFRKVQGFIYDNQSEGEGLLDLTEIEDMMNALYNEKRELVDALNQRTQQLDEYQQKVTEILQKYYDKRLGNDRILEELADELGVNLE